jgi:DNA-binding beta-propeller fold protein YncE
VPLSQSAATRPAAPQPTATASVGTGPVDIAIDTGTGFVYVADFASAAVSVLNGAKCNAHTTKGCTKPAPQQPVGSLPEVPAISQNTNTIYTMTGYGAGAMSIFKGSP